MLDNLERVARDWFERRGWFGVPKATHDAMCDVLVTLLCMVRDKAICPKCKKVHQCPVGGYHDVETFYEGSDECDECDGGGVYYLNGKPQKCICSEPQEEGMTPGVAAINLERTRQIEIEKWTADHDDVHTGGRLAVVAAMLAVHGTDAVVDDVLERNSWGLVEKHGHDRIRCLEIAGALIAAEIDRCLRKDVNESCAAVLFHGLGHQSQARCRLTGEHEIHEAYYGSHDQLAQWKGKEKCTGYFNEPPEEPEEELNEYKCAGCGKWIHSEETVWAKDSGVLSTTHENAKPWCEGCCPEQPEYD